MIELLWPDPAQGFQWWTIGWGVDRKSHEGVFPESLDTTSRWLKLGPVSLVTWTCAQWRRRYEVHCFNRCVVMIPGWKRP
jgi:hypothetical protein